MLGLGIAGIYVVLSLGFLALLYAKMKNYWHTETWNWIKMEKENRERYHEYLESHSEAVSTYQEIIDVQSELIKEKDKQLKFYLNEITQLQENNNAS